MNRLMLVRIERENESEIGVNIRHNGYRCSISERKYTHFSKIVLDLQKKSTQNAYNKKEYL